MSFCGYFPSDKPMYSCIVVVKEPQMAPAAAFMCGDVFKKVAERIYAQEHDKDLDNLNIYNYIDVFDKNFCNFYKIFFLEASHLSKEYFLNIQYIESDLKCI